jgi:hypothetical protein
MPAGRPGKNNNGPTEKNHRRTVMVLSFVRQVVAWNI